MDTPPKIGEIITDGDAVRDAIHVAIAPMIAAQNLKPGDHVGFYGFGDTQEIIKNDAPVGIVDPYLTTPIKKGEHFYLFLYPNTITALRHE